MPCLSIQYNPKVGPIIQVMIWKPGVVLGGSTPGAPMNANLYNALIDTGASCSSISDKVIKAEGLTPSGKQPVGGVHGNHPTNAYSFLLGVPFISGQQASGVMNASVRAFNINGIEFIPLPGLDVLLGRDVICTGSFTLSFDGHALLSL